MIEMPGLFDRYMKLGKKALEEEHYKNAKECFEAAYEIQDNEETNYYLVKTFFFLEDFLSAYDILCEKKQMYHSKELCQKLLFDILMHLNYFFEIEKFLVQIDGEEKKKYQKVYQIAKEYHSLLRKDEFDKIEQALLKLGETKSSEQVVILKQFKFLPSNRLVDIAKKLLTDPNVSLFVKADLIQQLSLVQYDKQLQVLGFDHQIKTVTPNEVKALNDIYLSNTLLQKVSTYFEMTDPSLKKAVVQTVKLHIGCFYPFHDSVMTPIDDWFSVYCEKYLGDSFTIKDPSSVKEIYEKQEKIDQEIAKLLSTE